MRRTLDLRGNNIRRQIRKAAAPAGGENGGVHVFFFMGIYGIYNFVIDVTYDRTYDITNDNDLMWF